MPKFGNSRAKIPKPVGKNRVDMLPSRKALKELAFGDPMQRSMGNYAKLTPSGSGALKTYGSIIDMGDYGPSLVPRKR